MFNFTLESIGRIGFGVKFNALRQKRLTMFLSFFLYISLF